MSDDNLDYQQPAAAAENEDHEQQQQRQPSGSAALQLPAELIGNTVADVKAAIGTFLLLKVYLSDIERRAGAPWHKATLILGVFLLPACLLCFIIEQEVTRASQHANEAEDTHTYRDYVVTGFALSLAAQSYFTLVAIATENAAMLVSANCLAVAVLLRAVLAPVVTDDAGKERVARVVLQVLLGVLVGAHIFTSIKAWTAADGFRRFVFYACGGATYRVQERFKLYQSCTAVFRVDLFFSLLATAAVAFFMKQKIAWHYVFLVLLVLFNALWLSLLRRTVRTELCIFDCMQDDGSAAAESAPVVVQQQHQEQEYGTATAAAAATAAGVATDSSLTAQSEAEEAEQLPPSGPKPSWCTFWTVVLPINAVTPLMIALAVWDSDFVDTRLASNSKFIIYLTLSIFAVARVLQTVAIFLAWSNFGKGMKDVFARERGVADYLLGGVVGGNSSSTGAVQNSAASATSLQRQPSDAFASVAAQARAG